jgi:rubredoxin
MAKYRCKLCGWEYDESIEKEKFDNLRSDYACPLCGAGLSEFEKIN